MNRFLPKEVTLKQFFALSEGIVSTNIEDVFEMLNFIFSKEHSLEDIPKALKKLKEENPLWFRRGSRIIINIKVDEKTDDFETLMKVIDKQYQDKTIFLEKIDNIKD